MSEQETIQTITAVIQDFGIWAVFAWLFIQERKNHMDSVKDHIEDLKVMSARGHNISQMPIAPPPLPENPKQS